MLLIAAVGLVAFTHSSGASGGSQPCYVGGGVVEPGVSVVTENGVPKCVVGPPLVVSDDGQADFRNGTVVDLNVNATGASVIGAGGEGGSNDTVVLINGTRMVFNSRGVIVTISPYKGEQVFSNGTIILFPACRYPITPDLHLSSGLSGNGTVWYTSSNGTVVIFYPNGTCSETTSPPIITTQMSSSSSSTCSGYPPGGNCLAIYSYTFTLSVNYTGPWKVTYQGYNSLGKSNPINVSGSRSGTGYFSIPITLSGLNNNGLTLCAQAQKLDASNSTLILTVTGHNETSVPYGTVSYCGGVVP
jgi:hypothetical protein